MIDVDDDYIPDNPIPAGPPVSVVTGWHREYDRNTGNWNSFPHYTCTWSNGESRTFDTIPNDWHNIGKDRTP